MQITFFQWIKSVWSLWLSIIIMIVSLIWYTKFGFSEKTYKCISLCAQLVGSGFIVYSINENIKIIFQKDLKTFFIEWIKSFPFRKQDGIAIVHGVESKFEVGKIRALTTNNFNTIEEELMFLHTQLKNIDNKIDNEIERIEQEVLKQSNILHSKIVDQNNNLLNLKSNVEKIYAGINSAIFGIFLMIFSVIMGTIPDVF